MNTITHLYGFQAITGLCFNPDPWKEGKNLLRHVLNVSETRTIGTDTSKIRATVLPQMRHSEPPYDVHLDLDKSRRVIDSLCGCTAGQGGQPGENIHCKHVSALYFFINTERHESKTDKACLWTTPAKRLEEEYPKGVTYESLFTMAGCDFSTEYDEDPDGLEWLRGLMEEHDMKERGLYKTIVADTNNIPPIIFHEDPIPNVIKDKLSSPLLFKPTSAEFERAKNSIEPYMEFFYESFVKIDTQFAHKIFAETIKQALSFRWHHHKSPRITSSGARPILKGKTKQTRINHWKSKCPGGVASVSYGREMEAKAKEAYKIWNPDHEILESGLLVCEEYPFLGASPDRFILTEDSELFLLEIKCPWKFKDKHIDVSCSDYIGYEQVNNPETGEIISARYFLKHDTLYFCQIQLQLYLAKLEKAILMIWSSVDIIFIDVKIDKDYL